MSNFSATAVSCANIAFIKYWGNLNEELRIAQNGSISMNLAGLEARTTVTFTPSLSADRFTLNSLPQTGKSLERVSRFLNLFRVIAGIPLFAEVSSANNFPTGAGIASSAAAFSALSVASAGALHLSLAEAELSRLARRGSGSACRSVPGGFVEWLPGTTDANSYAVSIAGPEHWNLTDCIAVIQSGHKQVGSTEGHALAESSPLQAARVADAPRRLEVCRRAILERDFNTFADIVEQDSTMMHAVMMTSRPPLFYWHPTSLEIIKLIPHWRADGLPACATLDAGANVHVLCPAEYAIEVTHRLQQIPAVEKVLQAGPGGPAHLISD